MFNKLTKLLTILTASTWLVSGCALSTSASASTGPLPAVTQAINTSTSDTGSGTTAPGSQMGNTTSPAATTAVTTDTQDPASTSPDMTIPETTLPGTGEPEPENPIDPKDIKTGNAYDTATVRDWMWNRAEADYYPEQKLVFLTFDDGPSWNITPRILDVLKANSVNATFFYYTRGDLSSRADIVRRAVQEGNVIGIHTNSHNYSQLYPRRIPDKTAILEDVQAAIAKIRGILGADWNTGVYRFPGGSFSWTGTKEAKAVMNDTKSALADLGLQYLDWNALSGDSDTNNKDKSAAGLVRYTIKTTRNAAGHVIVLLMHDAGAISNGPEALQGIIDYYKKEGYEFGVLK